MKFLKNKISHDFSFVELQSYLEIKKLCRYVTASARIVLESEVSLDPLPCERKSQIFPRVREFSWEKNLKKVKQFPNETRIKTWKRIEHS
jgi:hypothetical protein